MEDDREFEMIFFGSRGLVDGKGETLILVGEGHLAGTFLTGDVGLHGDHEGVAVVVGDFGGGVPRVVVVDVPVGTAFNTEAQGCPGVVNVEFPLVGG